MAKDDNPKEVTLADIATAVAGLTDTVKTVSTRVGAIETQAATRAVQKAPAAPAPDTSGGPDPITDPDGFQKHVRKQIDDGVAAGLQTVNDAQANSAAVGKLHARLVEAHPHLAKQSAFVERAAEAVVRRNMAKGMDARQAMFANEDQFIADVKEEADKSVALFRKEAGVEAKPDNDDDTDDNTGAALPPGGMGGLFGGGKKGPTAEEDKNLPTMNEQMAEASAKMFNLPKT